MNSLSLLNCVVSVSKIPGLKGALGMVKNAVKSLVKSSGGETLANLYNRANVRVELGEFPDIGVKRFAIVKPSGELFVKGESERGTFRLSYKGLLAAGERKVAGLRTIAQNKAIEAQRLAEAAANAAKAANAEVSQYESALNGVKAIR